MKKIIFIPLALLLTAFLTGCYPFNPNGRNWIEQGKAHSFANTNYMATAEGSNDGYQFVETVERLRAQRASQ
jgi:hypothetical protein